ncbi:Nitric oxide reductase transcription regulator NorR2, partial [termite gut metagenome]
AKQALLTYRWQGNVRQLKNVTEQISIIETNREITKDILLNYLPASEEEHFPTLLNMRGRTKNFESEREILYQVLFDMRKDVTELKKLVHDIMDEKMTNPTPQQPAKTAIANAHSVTVCEEDDDIQDAEEYVEETLSIDEVEKELIRKALGRHHGKRKYAARDLKISERTLYRKIKEYALD